MEKPVMNPRTKSARSSQPKPKKKPVKVVYIANPVRLTATAGEFRAVVQRFTGRDAASGDADADAAGPNRFACRTADSDHGGAPGPDPPGSEPELPDPFKIDEAFSSQLFEELSALYNNGSGFSGYI